MREIEDGPEAGILQEPSIEPSPHDNKPKNTISTIENQEPGKIDIPDYKTLEQLRKDLAPGEELKVKARELGSGTGNEENLVFEGSDDTSQVFRITKRGERGFTYKNHADTQALVAHLYRSDPTKFGFLPETKTLGWMSDENFQMLRQSRVLENEIIIDTQSTPECHLVAVVENINTKDGWESIGLHSKAFRDISGFGVPNALELNTTILDYFEKTSLYYATQDTLAQVGLTLIDAKTDVMLKRDEADARTLKILDTDQLIRLEYTDPKRLVKDLYEEAQLSPFGDSQRAIDILTRLQNQPVSNDSAFEAFLWMDFRTRTSDAPSEIQETTGIPSETLTFKQAAEIAEVNMKAIKADEKPPFAMSTSDYIAKMTEFIQLTES